MRESHASPHKKLPGKITFLVLIGIFFATVAATAWALTVPKPRGFMNDYAGLIDQGTSERIEKKLDDYERRTGNEVAVAIVDNLQSTTVEDYAVRMFEEWKIGKRRRDNGVLLLIAEKERRMRIEVGYGLEPELTDAEAFGIIERKISPAFKEGNYSQGLALGVDEIIKGLSGEELPESSQQQEERNGDRGSPGGFLPILYILFFAVPSWIASILARTKSWWLGGLIGLLIGAIAGIVVAFTSGTTQGIVTGTLSGIFLALLGAGFDYFVSNNYARRKREGRKPSWWAGGGWGPRGPSHWGGGGFGGFGGGRSGGGGASGGW